MSLILHAAKPIRQRGRAMLAPLALPAALTAVGRDAALSLC